MVTALRPERTCIVENFKTTKATKNWSALYYDHIAAILHNSNGAFGGLPPAAPTLGKPLLWALTSCIDPWERKAFALMILKSFSLVFIHSPDPSGLLLTYLKVSLPSSGTL